MNNTELIENINSSVDELDFVTGRRLIEHNLDVLEKYKSYLNRNARDFHKFIKDSLECGYKPPTRSDIATIQTINSYASSFHIRGIKLILKNKPEFFLKKDIFAYLNKDAKVILEDMGTIPKS